MSEPLMGAQEEHAREIAKQEVASFARLLLEELDAAMTTADGGLAKWTALMGMDSALRRFNEGEVVL